MTIPTPSRNPERTLADIIEVVENNTGLPKTKRQNMASAVRTAARVLGRPPHLIPADPVLLGRQLDQISPIAIGLSVGRWANIKSFLREAIALTRQVMPGRYCSPMSPAWKTLFDQLSQSKGPRLSRLCHWLSASSIEPSAVTREQIEAFGVELQTTSLSKDPEQTWRDAVWAWNNARKSIEGWPDIQLPVEVRRKTYTLPWTAFPTLLKEDVDRYLKRIGGKINLRAGPVRPVRPTTLTKREWELRSFASALIHQGVPVTSLTGIAALFEGENFVLGLEFFLNRNDGASAPGLEDMSSALVNIARHHVEPGKLDIEAMKSIAKRLQVRNPGMTAKNRKNLLPFNDKDNVQALVALPIRLMSEADRGTNPCIAARLAQKAVAIEILLMTAMRAGNLREIEIGTHLIPIAQTFHLVFEDLEVKNRMPLNFPLPAESAALVRHYLDRYHKVLAPKGSKFLFPGRSGGAKSKNGMSQPLKECIHHYTGLNMNQHLFRHATAKFYLDRNPGAHQVVTDALGHKKAQTTRDNYLEFQKAASLRHFDQVILDIRREAGRTRS